MYKIICLRKCLAGIAMVLPLFFSSLKVCAEEIVISDDGREVLLKGDGSWHYVSRDRYATASDGRRIVLRPDGAWHEEHTGSTAIKPETGTQVADVQQANDVSTQASQQEPLQFLLDSVEILRKKTRTHKSSRIDTRTVFRIRITNSTSGAINISDSEINTMSTKVQMESSSGAKFKLLDLNLDKRQLDPAETTTVTLTADGSPKWLNIKYLGIVLKPGALRNSSALQFRKSMDDINVRNVEEL